MAGRGISRLGRLLLGLAALGATACSPFVLPSALRPDPGGSRRPAEGPALRAPPTPLPAAQRELLQLQEETLVNVYERNAPGVVSISVEGAQLPAAGSASGFVVDKEGHLLTNDHVVAQADRILVTFPTLAQAEATVIGRDPHSDLALLRVQASAEELFPLELGDSSTLRVGQLAIAIGNPFGNINSSGGNSDVPTLQRSMTVGVISGLGRVVTQPDSRFALPMLIQTDANINPGNSGGPLLDSSGRVIGVNTLIFSPQGPRFSTGIGFAVPINFFKKIRSQLLELGRYQHPWIGIGGHTVLPDMARELELPETHGALVVQVFSGSPAEQSGLRPGGERRQYRDLQLLVGGDIIVAVDGVPVRTFDDLILYLSEQGEVGRRVVLMVNRSGQRLEVPITLGARPDRLEGSPTEPGP